jgi:hypothetical protein
MLCFVKNIFLNGIAEKKIEALENDLSLTKLIQKYDLEKKLAECLVKVTVLNFFMALNYGGVHTVEKYLNKTDLKSKTLIPLPGCLDEIYDLVMTTNKYSFTREIMETCRKVLLNKK